MTGRQTDKYKEARSKITDCSLRQTDNKKGKAIKTQEGQCQEMGTKNGPRVTIHGPHLVFLGGGGQSDR